MRPRSGRRRLDRMLQIHVIDDAGQPLCSVPDSDRWLWTVNPRAVTCAGCVAALAGVAATTEAATAAEPARPAAPGADGETASRTA